MQCACANCRRSAKKNETANEQITVVCVRFLRSVIEQLKLELMRYMDVQKEVWDNLCWGYRLAEADGLAETMVIAYPGACYPFFAAARTALCTCAV